MRKKVMVPDPDDPRNEGVTNMRDMHFHETTDDARKEDKEFSKVFIGRIPIMLKSTYCILKGLSPNMMSDLNECHLDQVCHCYIIEHGNLTVLC